MSAVERIEVSCDVTDCTATVVTLTELTGHGEQGWLFGNTIDLCPQHASASGLIEATRVERPAPPAAPTAGTSSTEGITLTMSAHDAVMVAAALERELGSWEHPGTLRYEMREVIRQLHAQIEDYARRQP